jgi:hypothetical protein
VLIETSYATLSRRDIRQQFVIRDHDNKSDNSRADVMFRDSSTDGMK